MPEIPIAHIAEDQRIHLLVDHITGTAALASSFAAEFGSEEWESLQVSGTTWENSLLRFSSIFAVRLDLRRVLNKSLEE